MEQQQQKNKVQHTPGPWHLGDALDCGKGLAICANIYVIARVTGTGYPFGTGVDSRDTANAQLIAAAPEMKEELTKTLPALQAAYQLALAVGGHVAFAAALAGQIQRMEGLLAHINGEE